MINSLGINNINTIYKLGLELNDKFESLYDYNSLNINPNETYVFSMDGQVVGFIHIQITDVISIINLIVSKEYRRQGIASRLINYVAHKYSDKSLLLEVSSNNVNAINLYKKMGFKTINIRKNYYNDSDAYVMEKSVI